VKHEACVTSTRAFLTGVRTRTGGEAPTNLHRKLGGLPGSWWPEAPAFVDNLMSGINNSSAGVKILWHLISSATSAGEKRTYLSPRIFFFSSFPRLGTSSDSTECRLQFSSRLACHTHSLRYSSTSGYPWEVAGQVSRDLPTTLNNIQIKSNQIMHRNTYKVLQVKALIQQIIR
jgi:hypothetical protein